METRNSRLIFVYIPCNSLDEAKRIGDAVMGKRLAPCYNIMPHMISAAFWPPGSGEIERVEGSVLIIKTVEGIYPEVEREINTLHSDKNPGIFTIPVSHVPLQYYNWFMGELKGGSV